MSVDIQTIADILGVESEKGVYPFKFNPTNFKDLYLIHYNPNTIGSTPVNSKVRNLRGTIVSLNQKKIVCSSFGYIPKVILNDVNETTTSLIDTDGQNYDLTTFPEFKSAFNQNTKFEFFASYDGAMIRVWKYEGELIISTHRQIDASKAYWASEESLKDKFLKYLTKKELENLNNLVENGRVAYFSLMDNDLMMASKFSLGKRNGLLVYNGVRNGDGTYPGEEFAWSWFGDLPTIENAMKPEFEKTTLFGPYALNLKDIHKILNQGYYDFKENPQNSPLCLGESVSLCYEFENKKRVIHITSEAYSRRFELVANDPNILHRSFAILKMSQYPKSGGDTYIDNFPPIPVLSLEQINAMKEPILNQEITGTVYTVAQLTDRKDYLSFDRRFDNAMMHYAFALPLKYQLEALKAIRKIKIIREKVITYVIRQQNELVKTLQTDNVYLKYIVTGIKYAKEKFKDVKDEKERKNLIGKSIRKSILLATGDYLGEMALMFGLI